MTIRIDFRGRLLRWLEAPSKPDPVKRGVLTMGRHSYAKPTVHAYVGDTAAVRIGDFTSMALDVEFLPGGRHHLDLVTTFPLHDVLGLGEPGCDTDPTTRDVHVGSDVWIGRGAKIVGPVTIGHGAVIAAYSVVVHDVAPYTIVAGTPATPKRRRFPDDVCDALLRIAWWNWPDEVVRDRVEDIMSPDVHRFIERYG